ncbi:hypothetical protein NMG60_11005074 [Bertholletia excelsa]
MEDAVPEFTLAEIMELESLYKEVGENCISQEFCQNLATKFSCSKHRTGKSTIKWEQVQGWFQDKEKELAFETAVSPMALEEFNPLAFALISNSPDHDRRPKGSAADLSELIYEAKSSKDDAWYDVASFLNYRILCTSELEVRVRFAGFDNQEDEWINVKRRVRQRSIPLEPSECDLVEVGDPVLCFRENDDHALYSDARVMDIKRNSHDEEDCTCVFIVCFDYDKTEENVHFKRICRRPK